MDITIDKESKTPIYMQIKDQIAKMIISEELPANFLLPPERRLSEILQVNRSTVVRAYMELKGDGLVESKQGRGTVVLRAMKKEEENENTYIPPLRWSGLESRSFNTSDNTITTILSAFEKDKIISFASGIPSQNNYDLKKLKYFQDKIFEEYKERLFMPTPVEGALELRQGIKEYLKEKGIRSSIKEIMVTSGSQQAIEFTAKLLIQPGDIILMEEPSYPGAIQAFEAYGARIIGIPMDSDGMKLEILENCLIKYRPKLIYCQPAFQNPTGITTSIEKRKALLQLSYYYNVPILEDNPYGELRFEGNTLPTIKSLDTNNYVIYISSFSKIISFSMRVGYVVADEYVISRFKSYKQISDIQTSTQAQLLVTQILKENYIKEHIKNLRSDYKKKRDLMVSLIKALKIEGLTFNIPEGGFFLWCKFPSRMNKEKFLQRLGEYGVIVMPGDVFSTIHQSTDSYLRLNYSYPTEEEITEGIKKLGQAIVEELKESVNSKKIYNINPFI